MCEALMEIVEFHKQRVRSEGKEEGRAEGRAEGERICLLLQIRKKLLKNKPLSQIADELEETEESILPLYNIAKAELGLE